MEIHIILIIEDSLSEAVVRTVLSQIEKPYRICNVLKWNKQKIQKKISSINNASRGFPYLVLTDQDTEHDCPPNQIKKLIRGDISPNLIYRFTTMEVESWVMAHRVAFAEFLSVSLSKIPSQVDEIPNPKEFLINLARKSRRYRLMKDIVPDSESTSTIGPDYNGRLCRFIRESWCVVAAAQHSSSLARALQRLQEFEPVLMDADSRKRP